MAERNFKGLIVRHRKSAVFFERETDLSIDGCVSYFSKDKTLYIARSELSYKYTFSEDEFNEFVAYMEQIANEAWTNFKPKEADSLGADYADYYDREFDSEGSLWLGKYYISLDGPSQPKTNNRIARLYKFNKRKFESFIYDLRKTMTGSEVNG